MQKSLSPKRGGSIAIRKVCYVRKEGRLEFPEHEGRPGHHQRVENNYEIRWGGEVKPGREGTTILSRELL